jgi:protein-arginine kinase
MTTIEEDNLRSSTLNKKHLYEEYMKKYDVEHLISEMANSLVHSLSPNPIIYMIKYLTGLLSDEERIDNKIDIPPPYPQGVPIVNYPKKMSENLLHKYLSKKNWPNFKYIKTRYNNNINNLTNLNDFSIKDKIGICLCDDDCISSYSELLNNIISDVHNIKYEANKEYYDLSKFPKLKLNDEFIFENLKKNLEKIRFEFNRNVEGYTYNNINKMNSKLKEEFEKEIQNLIEDKNIKKLNNIYDFINKDELLQEEIEWCKNSKLTTESYYNDKDRAIFANDDFSIIICINFANHFKLILTEDKKNNIDFIKLFNEGVKIIKQISLAFQFIYSKQFGYLTSDISLLGSGFRIASQINLNNENVNEDFIKKLNFTDFKIEGNLLKSYQNFHLDERDEISFLMKYFTTLLGLIEYNNNENNLNNNENENENNEKLIFDDNENFITKSYNETYDEIKNNLSCNGNTINDILMPFKENNKNKILFKDKFDYLTFFPFISQYLNLSQNFNLNELNHINHPENARDIKEINNDIIKKIKNINISIRRNLKDFPFPLNSIYKEKNSLILEKIKEAIDKLNFNREKKLAEFVPLNEAQEIIEKNGLTIKHNNELNKFNIDIDFPDFRGIIKFDKPNIFAIINDFDHIRIEYNLNEPKEDYDISKDIFNLLKILIDLNKVINFEYDEKFGFLIANPDFVGTGINAKATIKLNKLNDDEIKDWFEDKKLYNYNEIEGNNEKIIEINNIQSIGLSETEILGNLIYDIKDIIENDNEKN